MWRTALARRERRAHRQRVEAITDLMPTVLDAGAIALLPSEPLGPRLGAATNAVLWRDSTSMAGLLTVAGGDRLGTHTHHRNHHHIWVVRGAARIAGELLSEGSYAHIPAGVEHDIDATGTDGCTVFYLYQHPGS